MPTLLVQGTEDSLFGLGQADANARGIAANGAPVKVVWYAGGHDSAGVRPGRRGPARPGRRLVRLAPAGRRATDPGTGFEFPAPTGLGGGVNVQGGTSSVVADAYPGLDGADPADRGSVALSGPTQPVVTPAGGTPAAITTVPGLGSLGAVLGGQSVEIPGQFAAFQSEPLADPLEVVGASTVDLAVASPSGTATLFAKLYDVGPDGGQTLPAGLTAPLSLTGLSTDPTEPTEVSVTLPGIVHRFEAGHTMRLVVSSTDQAYRPAGRGRGLLRRAGRGGRQRVDVRRPRRADRGRARRRRVGDLPLVAAAARRRGRPGPAGLGDRAAGRPPPAPPGLGRRARRRGRAAAVRRA